MAMSLSAVVAAWIRGLIAEGAPPRVEVASEQGHPGSGMRSTFERSWRVILCREGRARFLAVRAGRPAEVRLGPGEALLVAPGTWLTNAPLAADAYASVGAVFRRDATRVVAVRCGRGRAADALARIAVEGVEVPHALDAEGRSWCDSLRRERGASAPDYRRHLGALLLCRLADLLERQPAGEPEGKAHATWAEACRLIEERCDQPIGRAAIARALGIHPNHLSRLFAQFGSCSFGAHVQRLRLERAASLVSDRRLPLAEVARLCGFGGAHQLIRGFRRAYGVTPRRYRG
jgi:AraC-like DNA-binding protein